jgi:hypothetical protein
MMQDQKIIRTKVGLLELAKQLGNSWPQLHGQARRRRELVGHARRSLMRHRPWTATKLPLHRLGNGPGVRAGELIAVHPDATLRHRGIIRPLRLKASLDGDRHDAFVVRVTRDRRVD